ncbi:MAG: hypothetical protein HY611_01160 [Elusimicrobia bacterium]|nr:hypothetical protein [Elusimicrobiota bacterium]
MAAWMTYTEIVANMAAILTAIGIFLTLWVYWRLLREAERTRQDQQIPVLCFRFREHESDNSGAQYSYRIVNAGHGTAFITDFRILKSRACQKGTPDIDTVLGPPIGDPILEIAFAFEPVFATDTDFQSMRRRDPELRVSETHYEIEYTDVFKRRFRTVFKSKKHEFYGPF